MKKKRYLPFGYQMNEGNIIPDILESSAVQSIFENYRNGASLQMLAKQKERFLAGGQSLVEENIPANMHYRKEPFVGNVVLCIVEPCGSNGTERRKMYGDA